MAFGRLLRHVSAGRTASEMPSRAGSARSPCVRFRAGFRRRKAETPQTPGRIGRFRGRRWRAGTDKDDSEGFDYDTDAGF